MSITKIFVAFIQRISNLLRKSWIDCILLIVLSIIPILATGASGALSPVDTEFSFYPQQALEKYSSIWFTYQSGYVYVPAHVANVIIYGVSSVLNSVSVPLWLISRLWYAIPIFLLALSGYYFASSIVDKNKRVVSLCTSILLVLSYYTVMTISIGGIRELLSVAFSIFGLSFFIRGILRKQPYYMLLVGLSFVLAAGIVSYALIAVGLAFLFLFSYIIMHRKQSQNVKFSLKFTLGAAIVSILCNLWWVLPLFFTSSSQNYNGNPSLWVESIASFNNIFRVLMLKNSVPAIPVNQIQFTLLTEVSAILFAVFAFSSLLYSKYRHITVPLALASLVLFPFALGGAPPFGSLFVLAVDKIPFFYMFRNPTRFTAFLTLFYAVLTSIFFVELARRLSIKRNVIRKIGVLSVIILVVSLAFVNSVPLLTGNMAGGLKPVQLPESYTELHDYLKNVTLAGSGNMLVLPMPAWFSDFTWQNDLNHIANPIRDISPVPLIYDEFNDANLNPLQKSLTHKFYSPISNDSFEKLQIIDALRILNVKYVLVQNDQINPVPGFVEGTNTQILKEIKNNLAACSPDIELVKNFGDLDLYEVSSAVFLPEVYGSSTPILSDYVTTVDPSVQPAYFLEWQQAQIQWQFLEGYETTVRVERNYFTISAKNSTLKQPYNWSQLNTGEFYARFYQLPKILVSSNTSVIGDLNYSGNYSYIFPKDNLGNWTVFNSNVIYLKTGAEPLIVHRILANGTEVNPDIINAWWETGWMGMGTAPNTYPIVIPPHQKAIIQINNPVTIENLTLDVLVPNIKINASGPSISFHQVSPTKTIVSVNASHSFFLIYSQTFNNGWVATINGQPIPWQYHFMANGYANGWFVNQTGNYEITLEFTPQNLFLTGGAVSVLAVVVCCAVLVWAKIRPLIRKRPR